eukprot:3549831-Lingulodinium_polyedra.AAC.1
MGGAMSSGIAGTSSSRANDSSKSSSSCLKALWMDSASRAAPISGAGAASVSTLTSPAGAGE